MNTQTETRFFVRSFEMQFPRGLSWQVIDSETDEPVYEHEDINKARDHAQWRNDGAPATVETVRFPKGRW